MKTPWSRRGRKREKVESLEERLSDVADRVDQSSRDLAVRIAELREVVGGLDSADRGISSRRT